MNNDEIVLSVISSSLLILLLVAGIIITFFISSRQRVNQQIELAETKLSFERELRQVETEVSEQVMTRFAEELHDNIGQLLTATHMQIETQKLDHPSLAESFKPVEIYLSEVIQQLRILSRTLNKDYIGQIDLISSIQLEVVRMRALKRFTVHLQVDAATSGLEKNQELMLFRIFQEITQNILRHSKASLVSVNLHTAQGFEMSIQDNGQGFEVGPVLNSGRASGLRNIIKRANLAGMSCEIISAPGEGSLFLLKKVGTLA